MLEMRRDMGGGGNSAEMRLMNKELSQGKSKLASQGHRHRNGQEVPYLADYRINFCE